MKKTIINVLIIVVILGGIVFAWVAKSGIKPVEAPKATVDEQEEPKVEETPNVEEPELVPTEVPKIVTSEEPKILPANEIKLIQNEEPKLVLDEGPKLVPVEETKKEELSPSKDDPNFDLVATELDLETLKSYKLPMLIDFGSEGCMPCVQMYPVLEQLNSELKGKAIVKFIDVWEYPDASKGFDFSLIPTQYFFDKDGNIYTSHTGGITRSEGLKILREAGLED